MASQDADDDEDDLAKKEITPSFSGDITPGSPTTAANSNSNSTRLQPHSNETNQNVHCDSISELILERENVINSSCCLDSRDVIDNNITTSTSNSSSLKFANEFGNSVNGKTCNLTDKGDENVDIQMEEDPLKDCPLEVQRWLLNSAQPEHLEQLLHVVARKKVSYIDVPGSAPQPVCLKDDTGVPPRSNETFRNPHNFIKCTHPPNAVLLPGCLQAEAAGVAAFATTNQQQQQHHQYHHPKRRRRRGRRRPSNFEVTTRTEDDLAPVSAADDGVTYAADSSDNDYDNDEEDEDDTQTNELVPTKKRNSITSDLFQLWLSTSPVKRAKSPNRSDTGQERRRRLHQLSEAELFMELIRDVANELDIDVLCHKILVNVGLLTHADRGSLFLARGPRDQRYLHAKLFDVTVDTALEEAVQKARAEEIRIPFGVGIAGLVAQSKQPINIRDAYQDPRFNSAIDLRTGYRTHVILCMPICNYEGEVIGVAQIINKTDGSREFTDRDVEVFRRYLTFCGIGLQNAQLFELSVLEFRRNQILLNLARSIFEEQNNLECLVTKIMTEARELLKCEGCAVFLLESAGDEAAHLTRIGERPTQGFATSSSHMTLGGAQTTDIPVDDILQYRLPSSLDFARIFELESPKKSAAITVNEEDSPRKSDPTLTRVARYVAATGQIVNIADASRWAQSARSVLSMPIVNGQKAVIGVAQLINKGNGSAFSECDVSILEAFAIFCGLGIHNTQMYENACKLMAKQRVALECLSYHATATADDTNRLIQDKIPSAETFNLFSFNFVDFDLSDEDTCRAAVRMFLQCDLVQRYHIPYPILCRWILSVKKNYRPVKYHNWRHALNVAQTMFAMLKTGKMDRFMTDLEILGLLVACLCHDLDHRGTNNAFQTKTDSPLAVLYSTSTMEHHHFDQCVMILNSEGNNLFQSLSTDDYRRVMRVVETAIISTDLAMYFKKKSQFLKLLDEGEFDWQSPSKKELLCGMMMTACDVSAIAKPWEIQHRVAKLVADEFFEQGDLEKLQLNQQPMAMMDRERKDELPQMQVDFIDHICLPLYKTLSEAFPWIRPLYEGCSANRQHWQDLAEKVNMGLTWIDHDHIDKPVEAFTTDSEPKDIEFTVTTLNTKPPSVSSSVTSNDGPTAVIRCGLSRLASIRKAQVRLPSSLHGRPGSGYHQQNSPTSPPPNEKPSVTNNTTTTSLLTNESNNTSGATTALTSHTTNKTTQLQPPRKAKQRRVCTVV